jgi:putative oxidoreductase
MARPHGQSACPAGKAVLSCRGLNEKSKGIDMADITQDPKLYFPGLAGLWSGLAPYGYPVIRFAAGAILIPHGWAKLFGGAAPFVAEKVLAPLGVPAPHAVVYLLALLETVGAVALALGLFTRLIAAMLVVEFLVITFAVNFSRGYFFNVPGGGYEFPLLLLLIFVGIFMHGSGRCSIDRMIGREI